ncbi:MAG: hypothetical protein WBB45_10515 [Cyclobacteriaceae bacterium]
MKLKDFQQNVLNALKDRPLFSEEHPYFTTLKDSYPYRLTQETVVYWRASQISRICVLTTRYLQAKGRLGEVILQLYREQSLSNFAEEISFFFLDRMSGSEDPVLASVAAFERSHLGLRFRRSTPPVAYWQYAPAGILHALMKNEYSDECLIDGGFVTVVSDKPEQNFEIYTIEEWHTLENERAPINQ